MYNIYIYIYLGGAHFAYIYMHDFTYNEVE